MSRFSLRARWVLPVERPAIAGGTVVVSGGRIESVGDASIAEPPLYDLGDVVLMPGLVNVHTHLEFSHLEQTLGKSGMPLPDWIRLVIASRRRSDCDPKQAIRAGLEESRRNGVTTLGEIATGTCSIVSSDEFPRQISYQEVIGFSAARIDSVVGDLEHRLFEQPATVRHASIGLSPHAPYTVHPQLLERLVDLASRQQLPMAMHLAESHEELELLATVSGPFRELLEERSMWDGNAIPPGTQPLNYLQALARAPRALVVHGNYLKPVEIEYLASRRERMSVAYCPRTHAFFRHSEYPLQQMLAAGVRVALGTDSRASNPDLSLLEEMRYLARRHTTLDPSQILEMGTLVGAEALGWEEQIGSLRPGKWADLTAVACNPQSKEPVADILSGIAAPTKTWLRGRLHQPARYEN
ncbi:MAG: amidohydrolase family protein [Planctomycetales bacterium]|nr:amidohydrolase family protein [Planctomycetales bacterium]